MSALLAGAAVPALDPTEVYRLLDSFTIGDDGACWLWDRLLGLGGYGRFRYRRSGAAAGTFRYAHRLVFTLLRGAIPEGLELHHKCVTRNCVRPSHLEATTPEENRSEANDRRYHGSEAMREHDERAARASEVPF